MFKKIESWLERIVREEFAKVTNLFVTSLQNEREATISFLRDTLEKSITKLFDELDKRPLVTSIDQNQLIRELHERLASVQQTLTALKKFQF